MDALLGARVQTLFSHRDNVEREVLSADLVIGGVLIPGAAAPKLVSRELLKRMQRYPEHGILGEEHGCGFRPGAVRWGSLRPSG